MIKRMLCLVITISLASQASAVLIGGIDFPGGAASFADAVVTYAPGINVVTGYNNPNAALGVPDFSGANNTAVSLGIHGVLVLQFTDNSLTTSGDVTPDLHVFEIGCSATIRPPPSYCLILKSN